ncbi:MAG TPA: alpha-ketoglutarate-dependent dioxygenase AlkB [Bdellovibrionota bacterium]|nr:alpha-ketoglutarate-dependent dioxygenase AlkB [Bdellovibrionota bacterium]
MRRQLSLLPSPLPEGFTYLPAFLGPTEEADLLDRFSRLDWKEVRMHGVVARRRVVHYGLDYTYDSRSVRPTDPPPAWLLPLQEKAARPMGVRTSEIAEVLLSKYPTGAGIGWHRDAPMFGDAVFGVSLGGECVLRLRYNEGDKPLSIELEPRSAYLLSGNARWNWRHSIPPVKGLRYSITFRTLRQTGKPQAVVS